MVNAKTQDIMITSLRPIRGGVERTLVLLIKNLLKTEKINVVLVSSSDTLRLFKKLLGHSSNLKCENIETVKGFNPYICLLIGAYKLLSKLATSIKERRLEKILDTLVFWIFYLKLNELIKKHKPDSILDAWIGAAWPIYAKFPEIKIPYSLIVHDLRWFYSHDFPVGRYTHHIHKTVISWFGHAKNVFVPSEKVAKEVAHLRGARARVITIRWSGAEETTADHSIRKGLQKDKYINFYYPANVSKNKNHILLFKSILILANKYSRFKVILSGDNTEYFIRKKFVTNRYIKSSVKFYREHKKILDKHLEILGYCDDQKINRTYKECDCVLALSNYEGFGLPLVEAFYNGISVISSDIEVFREQVNFFRCEDLVVFLPRLDADTLASCMENFILNPIAHKDSAAFAWTWNDIAERYASELAKN